MNVKPFSSKYKAAFVAFFVLLSSLGIASPAHAKTYKCSKGGSFKVIKGEVSEVSNCKGSVKIPKSVTDINSWVFSEFDIQSVTFEKGSKLKTIGDYAFDNSSISSVTIPEKVSSIGSNPFGSNLKNVYVSKSNRSYSSVGGVLFNKKKTSIVIYPPMRASGTFIIPSSVSYIEEGAFANSEKLRSVVFAKGTKLKSITYSTFKSSGIRSITIPASVTRIENEAFSYTDSLSSVTFANGSKLVTIEGSAFYESGITSITIPASVTSIGDEAFAGSSKLESVAFASGSKLKSIGVAAFSHRESCEGACEGATVLTGISIPANVTSIGGKAFYNVKTLESVTFASGSKLQSIGDSAFESADSISSITIPASVVKIGVRAFANMDLLGSVSFASEGKLTSIGESAFRWADSLTSVTIPASVIKIGSYAGMAYPKLDCASHGSTTRGVARFDYRSAVHPIWQRSSFFQSIFR